ncbi:hypothetical protein [Alteromonas lipotrueiana]|uniref:hypothetical protein n=1 Tax=Alteromonas lipotrueiana TaxID=2803815 RepID=UPI001C44E475|nr:hypothetical protein [Alteromonas lipotrueiana]
MQHSAGFTVIVPLFMILLMVTGAAMLMVDTVTQQSRFSTQIKEQQKAVDDTAHELTMAIHGSHIALRQPTLPDFHSSRIQLVNQQSALINQVPVGVFQLKVASDNKWNLSAQQQLIRYPLLQAVPQAAIMLSYTLPRPTRLNVHLTQSIGQPLAATLWSRETVTLAPGRQRCISLLVGNTTICESMLLNLPSLSGVYADDSGYPAHILPSLFGPEINSLSHLSDFAQPAENCQSLSSASTGLFVVSGNCVLSVGQKIGSETQPVLLILTGEMLNFAPHSQIYGLVLAVHSTSTSAIQITGDSESATVAGALIVDRDLDPSSQLTVHYRKDILLVLQKSIELQRVQPLKGSWRDF